MDKNKFSLEVLTLETRYLMDNETYSLGAFGRTLLEAEYGECQYRCEVCGNRKAKTILFAKHVFQDKRVRTVCCRQCGEASLLASKLPDMSEWVVKLYEIGAEVQVDDEEDVRFNGHGAGVQGLPAGDEGLEPGAS
jgi:peptide subunit release factor 1 (eRF1)